MKVFRWILSHLLLLVLVWTAVYIYLDWDNFREQLPVAVTDWIDNLSTRGVTTTEEPAVAIVAEEPVVVPPPQGLAAPVTEEAAEAGVTGEQEVTQEQPVAMTESPVQAPEAVAKPDDQTAAADEAASGVKTPEPVAGPEPVEAHELAAEEKDLLVQAREAFWRRDLAQAEELYSQLAQSQPGNPDLWGELGNLYFSQNKIEQASEAYYRAAEILIEEGRYRQVHSLMGIIGNVDQEKARKLFEKMQGHYPQQPMYMR